MPKSACLKCHRLIPVGESYCTTHKPRPKPKASPRQRGLDYQYDKNRAITLSISRVCVLCGKPGANSADHIRPRDNGGDNSLLNLAPSHLGCNSSRQAKPLTMKQAQRVIAYQHLLDQYLSATQ